MNKPGNSFPVLAGAIPIVNMTAGDAVAALTAGSE